MEVIMLICALVFFCASVALLVVSTDTSQKEELMVSAKSGQRQVKKANDMVEEKPFNVINIPEPQDGAPVSIIIYKLAHSIDKGIYNRRAELIKRKNSLF